MSLLLTTAGGGTLYHRCQPHLHNLPFVPQGSSKTSLSRAFAVYPGENDRHIISTPECSATISRLQRSVELEEFVDPVL